jgi:hypothetical protein
MKKYILFFVVLTIVSACKKEPDNGITDLSQTYKTTEYEGALAHEWMQLGYGIVKENFLYGPDASRVYAYLGMTIWESVYGGIPNAKSMADQVKDYSKAPEIDRNRVYDWGIVLSNSMRLVLPELVELSAYQLSSMKQLADLQEAKMMQKGLSEKIRTNSRELGTLVAQHIITRLSNDGREVIRNIVPTVPERDAEHKWYWDASTFNQTAVEPLWGTLRTFVVDNSQSCEIAAPFAYSESTSSDFYKDALEVAQIDKNSQSNRAMAFHWENGPLRTCSAACHWISIAEQVLKNQNSDLAKSAKTYALLGFTVADAYSVSWYHKYKFYQLRPATYIRERINPNWTAMLNTPPYPDYTSSSATLGGAAPIILKSVFDDIPFVDKTQLGSNLTTPVGTFVLPERNFTSFTKAGEEQAESRIIGGVHFRRGSTLGLESGRCVGNSVLSRLDFGF